MNLLDIVKGQVTGPLSEQAANFLEEERSEVTNALDAIFPSLLAKMASSTKGETAKKLFDMASGVESDFLGDISGLFSGGGGNVAHLMNSGSGTLILLMGPGAGDFIDKISSMFGLKGSSTSSLIKMAAPFLMLQIGGQIKKNNLDVEGLARLLGSQTNFIKNAIPSELIESVDPEFMNKGISTIDNKSNTTKDTSNKNVTDNTESTGKEEKDKLSEMSNTIGENTGNNTGDSLKTGGNLLKYLIPAIILLVLLSWFGLKTCAPDDDTPQDPGDTSEEMINTTGEMKSFIYYLS